MAKNKIPGLLIALGVVLLVLSAVSFILVASVSENFEGTSGRPASEEQQEAMVDTIEKLAGLFGEDANELAEEFLDISPAQYELYKLCSGAKYLLLQAGLLCLGSGLLLRLFQSSKEKATEGAGAPAYGTWTPVSPVAEEPAGLLCKACGAENEPAARFCKACGTGLVSPPKKESFCPACGTENDAGARYCCGCGGSLTAAAPGLLYKAPTVAPAPVEPPKEPSNPFMKKPSEL